MGSKQSLLSWIGAAVTRVDVEGKVSSMSSQSNSRDDHGGSRDAPSRGHSEAQLGFGERAFSAAGAAILSAIIVNPLDVAKVLLYLGLGFMNFSTFSLSMY